MLYDIGTVLQLHQKKRTPRVDHIIIIIIKYYIFRLHVQSIIIVVSKLKYRVVYLHYDFRTTAVYV